eukprot:CAMPEP_0195637356 /NCGR_PEP_ID=MMETSP0815-20121206/24377_1 /TAXON_ID=97485 /ORGANISM="Prymnesium parvum, Strain Texoma1" /LENGTH=261 /DNA_ID=CAMNT_0040779563 /DNA_START=45 /DNA_END=827 /DNA_ORIENTATION=+
MTTHLLSYAFTVMWTDVPSITAGDEIVLHIHWHSILSAFGRIGAASQLMHTALSVELKVTSNTAGPSVGNTSPPVAIALGSKVAGKGSIVPTTTVFCGSGSCSRHACSIIRGAVRSAVYAKSPTIGWPSTAAVQPQLVAPAGERAEQQLGDRPVGERASADDVELSARRQRRHAVLGALHCHPELAWVRGVLPHAALFAPLAPRHMPLHQRQVPLAHTPRLEQPACGARRPLAQPEAQHAARRVVELVHIAEAMDSLGVGE